MRLTQIVPKLPPEIDGVGDYAINLACQLRQDFGIESNFAIGDYKWMGETSIAGFSIGKFTDRSVNDLLSILPVASQTPATVLLHYVGYGYALRGCPFWLVRGLERWKAKNPNLRLVTMFHEVYSFGRPPWTSAFWLSPLQKSLAARLAQLSDACLTSKQGYAKILYHLSAGKHANIPTLPVFSNIGEPRSVTPLTERQRHLIVFGSPSNRLRVYQESSAELSLTCQQLEIEQICDIGSSTGLALTHINGVPVVEMGRLPATEISQIMLQSLAGFFDYHTDFLAKSTIFAAYCAHGLLPVSPRCNGIPLDGIESGKHYWIPLGSKTRGTSLVELQAIANQAYHWYQGHNLSIQAKTFAAQLSADFNHCGL